MKKEKPDEAVRAYLAEIGGRGGRAKVAKGFAVMTAKERAAVAKKAAAARWGKKKAKE
jgi:hypothetical protein